MVGRENNRPFPWYVLFVEDYEFTVKLLERPNDISLGYHV
jgi:hypothetical protein